MKEFWKDLIDINAGTIITGEKTVADVGTDLFNYILEVASGERMSKAEELKLYNDIVIFNPAPMT